MEERSSPPPPPSLPSLEQFAQAISAARARTRDVLAAQRRRLEQMEGELTRQMQIIAEDLERDRHDLGAQQSSVQAQAEAIEKQRGELLADQNEWERTQDETYQQQQGLAAQLQRQRDELDQRAERLTESEADLRRIQRTFEAAQQELEDEAAEMARSKKRLEEKQTALDDARDQVEEKQSATNHQRRRIARELREQRELVKRDREELAEWVAREQRQLNEREAALAASQDERESHQEAQAALEKQLTAAHAELAAALTELTALRLEIAALRAAQVDLAAELEVARQAPAADPQAAQRQLDLEQKLELAFADLRELKHRNAELEEESRRRPANDAHDPLELTRLRDERDLLVERLEAAEARVKTPPSDNEVQRKIQDLQRRFEMAVDDVRELKLENSELKEQVAAARKASSSKSSAERDCGRGEGLDWEAQKRRLLAALEEEFDEDDEDDRQQRLTIEGAIGITDEVVADKEREIAELKQLLEEQSSNLGQVAIGAAAIAAALDQDELVCEERERLAALRAEWEAKLRDAEIGLSVERAQLARQRAELETKAHALQAESARLGASPDGKTPGKEPAKPARGRWLSRLGLKDDKEG